MAQLRRNGAAAVEGTTCKTSPRRRGRARIIGGRPLLLRGEPGPDGTASVRYSRRCVQCGVGAVFQRRPTKPFLFDL